MAMAGKFWMAKLEHLSLGFPLTGFFRFERYSPGD